MRYLSVLVVLLVLTGCAQIEPLASAEAFSPTDEDPCRQVDCGPSMTCVDYWGAGVCVLDRRDAEVCDRDCGPLAGCFHGRCVEADTTRPVCEFDSDCEYSEFCVVAWCTELACIPGETQPCYYGPSTTAGVGECRSGYHLCTNEGLFTSECIGQVVPASDSGFLACNGRDDNCDGITDAGDIEAVDIVIAYDISGSMIDEMSAVSEAIRRLSILYNHPSIRLALIVFPDPLGDWASDHIPRTMIELSNYTDFIFQLSWISWLSTTSGGEEASWDIPLLLARNLQPDINFRRNAKPVVIMFTDERGQTYFEPSDLGLAEENNEQHMCEAVEDRGLLLYVITAVGEEYRVYDRESENPPEVFLIEEDFDDCATVFPLTTDPQDMVDNLSDIADLVCVE